MPPNTDDIVDRLDELTTVVSSLAQPFGISDLIQLLAIVVALGVGIAAIVIATKDRKTQLEIARQNLEHSRLALELEYAVRLSANMNMGGSSDAQERKRLGAEALALASVIGPRWAPRQYARAMNFRTPDELRERLNDTDRDRTPRWVREKIEAGLAVQAIMAAMYGEEADAEIRSALALDPSDRVDDGWPSPDQDREPADDSADRET
ncbi:hypothetical protein ACFUTX_11975 [Microbacterium sp. NPDC057407]|uniref:hypothetical protein n=1 Tax=Microbacterium sp. NPDC057407 TaxID=3346120 RepID=UPI00366E5202